MLHSRASNSVGPTVNSWLHRYRNLNILAKKQCLTPFLISPGLNLFFQSGLKLSIEKGTEKFDLVNSACADAELFSLVSLQNKAF